MAAKLKFKSDAFEAIHSSISAMYRIGTVDKATMRHFDERCLTAVEQPAPEEISRLREREGVSQHVFARYLNVPVTLVSQWERGQRKPSGAAVKLLALVKHKGLAAIA